MAKRPGFVAELGRQLAEAAPRAVARRRRIDRVVGGAIGLAVIVGVVGFTSVALDRDESTELVAGVGDESAEVAAAIEVLAGVGWDEAALNSELDRR